MSCHSCHILLFEFLHLREQLGVSVADVAVELHHGHWTPKLLGALLLSDPLDAFFRLWMCFKIQVAIRIVQGFPRKIWRFCGADVEVYIIGPLIPWPSRCCCLSFSGFPRSRSYIEAGSLRPSSGFCSLAHLSASSRRQRRCAACPSTCSTTSGVSSRTLSEVLDKLVVSHSSGFLPRSRCQVP